jgi:MazG family protein
MKATETGTSGNPRTTLGGVPRSLPSLLRAHEIGTRASAVGFDWERAVDVVGKIEEEVAELRQAIEAGASARPGHTEEEMGDLLFAIANLARKLGIEPEAALRQANDKFTRRFGQMEAAVRAGGRALHDCSLQEMEDEWGRVKLSERPEAPGSGRPPSAR